MINRREFIIRSAKAGIISAGAGLLSYLLYDPSGPGRSLENKAGSVLVPDFSISSTGPKMAVVTGTDRAKALQLGLEALGGIERFIAKDDRVLVKVNAAFALPPFLGATTHPDLVFETVRLCLKAGAASVLVTDNPINDSQSCFALSGIGEACTSAGGELVFPKEGFFKPVSLDGGKLIQNWPVLYEPLKRCNKLIGISPVKDHHRSGASMTMKNWYGFMGGRRSVFHQYIHEFIVELAAMVRPTLVILDGTVSMMKNGPTGGSLSDLKQTNTLILSTDQVAADAFGATLLDKTPGELPFIVKAQDAGLGTADYRKLNPIWINSM